jgi:hypothetical protein
MAGSASTVETPSDLVTRRLDLSQRVPVMPGVENLAQQASTYVDVKPTCGL